MGDRAGIALIHLSITLLICICVIPAWILYILPAALHDRGNDGIHDSVSAFRHSLETTETRERRLSSVRLSSSTTHAISHHISKDGCKSRDGEAAVESIQHVAGPTRIVPCSAPMPLHVLPIDPSPPQMGEAAQICWDMSSDEAGLVVWAKEEEEVSPVAPM